MAPTTTLIRYICRTCGNRWSQPRKTTSLQVMDRPISTPHCEACREAAE